MKKTPTGTAVGVDDPSAHAGPCDHVTGDGKCRSAFGYPGYDRAFAAEDYRCPATCDCVSTPAYCSTSDARECKRCGLEERRDAHTDARPLLEESAPRSDATTRTFYGDGR